MAALEPTGPRAKGEPGDACVGDPPPGDGQAVLLGGSVELAPLEAGAGADPSSDGVDLDLLERTHVDHEPVVDGREACERMPARPDCERHLRLEGEAERSLHV